MAITNVPSNCKIVFGISNKIEVVSVFGFNLSIVEKHKSLLGMVISPSNVDPFVLFRNLRIPARDGGSISFSEETISVEKKIENL